LVGFIFPAASNFTLVFLLIIIFNSFLSPVGALGDSATMTMLGEQRAMYGRIRLGGTIGWGVFAPIAGFLAQNYGLKAAFWAFSILMMVNLLVSQKFSFGKSDVSDSNHGGIKTLLTNRRWIYFLLTAFLGGLGIFSATTYLYPYMKELGANEIQMGAASTIATLTEIVIFFFADRLVKRFNSQRLFAIALLLIGIRSLLYAAVNTTYMVWIVQAFGGMIFPAMWSAGVAYADENAPAGLKSTAMGLLGAMAFGFSSAIGGFISGPLLESLGGRGMFLVFGIIILVGLVLIEGVKRLFPEPTLLQAEM
jgi:PPP family 3-phenylpropionic acid transporter